jgi:hypothetical protein
VAFGDFRDQLLLEFETRIYNNLKIKSDIPLTWQDIIPGQFRTTDYSLAEVNQILAPSFLTWVGWNKLAYQTMQQGKGLFGLAHQDAPWPERSAPLRLLRRRRSRCGSRTARRPYATRSSSPGPAGTSAAFLVANPCVLSMELARGETIHRIRAKTGIPNGRWNG